MKYRKKPVVIEAMLWDGMPEQAQAIAVWMGATEENPLIHTPDPELEWFGRLTIHTLEGDMTAAVGDYIIKGVQGEFYPCKPDIFEETYERAD